MRAAQDRPLAEGAGVLVIVTLYGGNDGINTLIPYADNAYHDARPDLAYAPGDVIHLDEQLGLNPAMKGLAQLWNQRQLAIVRGVGYPQARPQPLPVHGHLADGVAGRARLDRLDRPLARRHRRRPVARGQHRARPAATGRRRKVHGGSAFSAFQAQVPAEQADRFDAIMGALGADDPNDTPAMAAVCKAYRAARTTNKTFASVKPAAADHNSLAAQLSMVAAAVKARVPTRVYTVQLGGFDTHADERETQQRLLQTLDEAVTPFLQEMAGDRYGSNVVLMAYSEFGRRVRANASQGTDHGTAGPVFVAGAPVKGGFYGEEPSLTNLDNGDLKFTTDFRDIYYELLTRTVGTDPTPSVGAGRTRPGLPIDLASTLTQSRAMASSSLVGITSTAIGESSAEICRAPLPRAEVAALVEFDAQRLQAGHRVAAHRRIVLADPGGEAHHIGVPQHRQVGADVLAQSVNEHARRPIALRRRPIRSSVAAVGSRAHRPGPAPRTAS